MPFFPGFLVVVLASAPSIPTILEPPFENMVLNGADVHMATAAFADADGDQHLCSDWEIADDRNETVWTAPCATGSARIHLHLGDGRFLGSHEGQTALLPDGTYSLRVRHRDDSGDAQFEWSAWAQRSFRTAAETPIASLQIDDLRSVPPPLWNVDRPAGARLKLAAADGDVLLTIGAEVRDGKRLTSRAAVQVIVEAGSEPWHLPESTLTFYERRGGRHSIFLPALTLESSETKAFWVAANGSTYVAEPDSRTPAFEAIARGAPIPWSVMQPGFRVEHVASGFRLPVNIAFVPEPRSEEDAPFFYVTELYGTIKVVTRGGEVRDYATGLLNFTADNLPLPGPGEIGLVGIMVEPESGDVIATLPYWPGALDPFRIDPKIIRLRSDDGGLSASRVETILAMDNEPQAPAHQISTITLGPDRKLYVHLGDSLQPAVAQDLSSFRGKIIRLNLDGSAPPDNPFFDESDGMTATDYVFALGFRNPFGGAWRAADGSLYELENGAWTDRLAKVVPGRNYLWDGKDDSMYHYAIHTWHQHEAPVNLVFVQRETFGGSGFPESKHDRAFFSESGSTWSSGPQPAGKTISELALDAEGRVVDGARPLVKYNGSGKATAVALAAGPDGLYFSDLYKDYGYVSPTDRGANVFRVRWVGSAEFHAAVSPNDGLSTTFSDLSDVADASSWKWSFGDGRTSEERHPHHRYDHAGTYLVQLDVEGPAGAVTKAREVYAGREIDRGLSASYFAATDLTTLVAKRTDESIDFDWGTGAPNPLLPPGAFSIRWEGRIRPRFSETYRFSLRTDDRVRLWIAGQKIVDAWGASGVRVLAGEIDLDAGELYELVLEYANDAPGASVQLLWESQTQRLEPVPGASLSPPPTFSKSRVRAVRP